MKKLQQFYKKKDKREKNLENKEEILKVDKYRDLETKEIMSFIQSGKDSLIEPWALIEILSLGEKDRENLEKIYEDYKNKEREQELIGELSLYEERLEKAKLKNDKDAINFF